MSEVIQQIKAWSASRLDVYESCPHRAELKYLEKIPEAPRPAPPNGKEHANDRGSRVHDVCERFVLGKRNSLCTEARHFKDDLEKVRQLYADEPTSVVCEEGWAFNDCWEPVNYKDYNNIWLRVIIDLLVFVSPTEAIVIDYKTGKRYGNEIKHGKQVQLYQLAAFERYPELEKVTTELWYTDQNELATMTFKRSQGLKFLKGYNERALRMTNAIEFPCKPSAYACRFCPYQKSRNKWLEGTGDCDRNPDADPNYVPPKR